MSSFSQSANIIIDIFQFFSCGFTVSLEQVTAQKVQEPFTMYTLCAVRGLEEPRQHKQQLKDAVNQLISERH